MRKKKAYQRVKTGLRSLVYLGGGQKYSPHFGSLGHYPPRAHFKLVSFQQNYVLVLNLVRGVLYPFLLLRRNVPLVLLVPVSILQSSTQ